MMIYGKLFKLSDTEVMRPLETGNRQENSSLLFRRSLWQEFKNEQVKIITIAKTIEAIETVAEVENGENGENVKEMKLTQKQLQKKTEKTKSSKEKDEETKNWMKK